MTYSDMSRQELETLKKEIERRYAAYQAQDMDLNMARGKPSAQQLSLSDGMLNILQTSEDCFSNEGADCRNYGVPQGILEARKLIGILLDDDPQNVLIGSNSSLCLMYDYLTYCMCFGVCDSKPWKDLDEVKWICLVPGYDRHFAITQKFGIQNIPVPLNADGPDMDMVESLVASDPAIKGIWCVPKYSNPTGITYSDEVVRRLASMECAADDFRIIWDNAYSVHHLSDDPANQDQLLDIGISCREAGNPNRYVKFASTSKVTLPGGGIAAIAASPDIIADISLNRGYQTIGGDKMAQLRHVRFLRDQDGLKEQMEHHAAILRPKFQLVEEKLKEHLSDLGECTWSNPRGGYFVSFNGPEGTAKRTVQLAKEAGVVMTKAGATWPGGIDPHDSNIRIAPTYPPLDELDAALEIFCACVKLAYLEKLLAE